MGIRLMHNVPCFANGEASGLTPIATDTSHGLRDERRARPAPSRAAYQRDGNRLSDLQCALVGGELHEGL